MGRVWWLLGIAFALHCLSGSLGGSPEISGAGTAEPIAQPQADLILHHGKIVTVDKHFSIQQALAAAEGMPSRRMQPELQMEALVAFCRQNLGDGDLS